MHMVEKILNNTTPYGEIRASHEGSLHSSTLTCLASYVEAERLMVSIHFMSALCNKIGKLYPKF